MKNWFFKCFAAVAILTFVACDFAEADFSDLSGDKTSERISACPNKTERDIVRIDMRRPGQAEPEKFLFIEKKRLESEVRGDLFLGDLWTGAITFRTPCSEVIARCENGLGFAVLRWPEPHQIDNLRKRAPTNYRLLDERTNDLITYGITPEHRKVIEVEHNGGDLQKALESKLYINTSDPDVLPYIQIVFENEQNLVAYNAKVPESEAISPGHFKTTIVTRNGLQASGFLGNNIIDHWWDYLAHYDAVAELVGPDGDWAARCIGGSSR